METIVSKYYIPDIEEFHVGFRYEVQKIVQGRWHSDTVRSWRDRSENDLRVWIDTGRVRVKYLDQADIEELRWEFDEKLEYDDILRFIMHDEDYTYLLYLHSDGFVEIVSISMGNASQSTLFSGETKNYNELKRIMNQIGLK